MAHSLSIKTKFGWFSAFENKGKIIKIKFGKTKKQTQNKILKAYRINLINFFDKKEPKIRVPYKVEGNLIQKKCGMNLKELVLERLSLMAK